MQMDDIAAIGASDADGIDTDRSSTWRASLSLRFERRGERTALVERRHEGPLLVQKPLYPEGEVVCHAIVVHPPGGIAGGDELSLAIAAGSASRALLTTPGATRWYRSSGVAARQGIQCRVAEHACLEWLPQETIFYNGVLARLSLDTHLASGARYIGWEVLCFGRTGSGERFTRGRVQLCNRVFLDEQLAWTEAGAIDGGGALLGSAVGLAGASVWGTLVAAGPALEELPLGRARALAPSSGEGAVTRLPRVLLARYLGNSSEAAKLYFAALWGLLRPVLVGCPAQTPRIWST